MQKMRCEYWYLYRMFYNAENKKTVKWLQIAAV